MTKARDLANAADVLDDVSATELGHLDGVTSAIQTQLNAKQAVVSGVNDTEIGYLDGVTSAIQTQLDAKTAKSTLTTTGDIYYASAANTPARLGIGSTSDVLTVVAGVPGWATPAAGGGQTQIATGSLTGSTVNITSIPGTYRDLKLVISNFLPATDNAQMFLRFNGDSSSYARGTSLDVLNVSFGEAEAVLSNPNDNGAGNNKGMNIATISEYANTTMWKTVFTTTLTQNGTSPSNFNYSYYYGFWNETTAITEINLICSPGNFTSGTYTLYGVK